MKALSIKQPWAWLIVNGYKDIENRSYPLGSKEPTQRIYIHASKNLDESGWDFIKNILTTEHWAKFCNQHARGFRVGAIVGEVTFTGRIVNGHSSPWFVGPYGLVLNDPIAYEIPIPCKGQLGFFNPTLHPQM